MPSDLTLPAPYTPHPALTRAFDACPLIAIMRGITPAEAADHGLALHEAGFRIVEVPLNSPDPFDSIAALRRALPDDMIVGAGTVLRAELVDRVQDAGGTLIVMPHSDAAVIRRAREGGLASAPGVRTGAEDRFPWLIVQTIRPGFGCCERVLNSSRRHGPCAHLGVCGHGPAAGKE